MHFAIRPLPWSIYKFSNFLIILLECNKTHLDNLAFIYATPGVVIIKTTYFCVNS